MKYWTVPVAIVILGVGLTACDRQTKTTEKSTGTTVVQPTTKEKETVVTTPGPTGPAGPAGAPGEKGEPGKSATDSSTPAPSSTPSSDAGKESSSETKSETTTETKKE